MSYTKEQAEEVLRDRNDFIVTTLLSNLEFPSDDEFIKAKFPEPESLHQAAFNEITVNGVTYVRK